jgi:pyruvate-ferredoxin/flavodoxin oxidoreductase
MLQALAYKGPALIQVYAPSPTRHGFASEHSLQQALRAVTCRALPLFRYDPAGKGVFGSRISLDGNPECGDTLAPDASGERLLTPADWALGQRRFASCFRPLATDVPTSLPLHEWLRLDARGRTGKTPYVAIAHGDEELRYSMAQAMIEMTEQCLDVWQTLQELAGIVTPFTERLEQDIRAAVAAEHEAELAAQKHAADLQIQEMQEKTQLEIAAKIRSRLLELASRKRS